MTLTTIADWPTKGRQARYGCRMLAKLCGVCPGYLNEYFVMNFHRPPQGWLNELRMWDAYRLLCEGAWVKEVAYMLFYKQISHFSRAFSDYYGFGPSQCREIHERLTRTRARCVTLIFEKDSIHPDWQPLPDWVIAEHALFLRLKKEGRADPIWTQNCAADNCFDVQHQ